MIPKGQPNPFPHEALSLPDRAMLILPTPGGPRTNFPPNTSHRHPDPPRSQKGGFPEHQFAQIGSQRSRQTVVANTYPNNCLWPMQLCFSPERTNLYSAFTLELYSRTALKENYFLTIARQAMVRIQSGRPYTLQQE